MTYSENSVIVSTNVANQGAAFTMGETKLYVSIVTLLTKDNAKWLTQSKSCYKRTNNWKNIGQDQN